MPVAQGLDPDGHWHGGPDLCPVCGGLAPELQGPDFDERQAAWQEAENARYPIPHLDNPRVRRLYDKVRSAHDAQARRNERLVRRALNNPRRKRKGTHPWVDVMAAAPKLAVCRLDAPGSGRPDDPWPKAVERVIAWMPTGLEPFQNLGLYGPTGGGKSSLAAATAYELWANGIRPVAWWSAARLVEAIKPNQPDVELTIRTAETARVLVLDDLDAVRPTEFAISQLELIVDYRITHDHLVTISTFNSDKEGLQKTIGERLVSRLVNDAIRIPVIGPDRRSLDDEFPIPPDLFQLVDNDAKCPVCEGFRVQPFYTEEDVQELAEGSKSIAAALRNTVFPCVRCAPLAHQLWEQGHFELKVN